MTLIQIVISVLGTIPQRLGKGTGKITNPRMTGDFADYATIKIN